MGPQKERSRSLRQVTRPQNQTNYLYSSQEMAFRLVLACPDPLVLQAFVFLVHRLLKGGLR